MRAAIICTSRNAFARLNKYEDVNTPVAIQPSHSDTDYLLSMRCCRASDRCAGDAALDCVGLPDRQPIGSHSLPFAKRKAERFEHRSNRRRAPPDAAQNRHEHAERAVAEDRALRNPREK